MTEGRELARINPADTWAVAERVAQAAAASKRYDARNAADLALRIQFGMELGMGPATALQSVQIVQDRPQLTAQAIGARIKASGKYDYRVLKHTAEECTVRITQGGEVAGESTFTRKDAETAGLWGKQGPWRQHPRNMLFARALTNAARWYCPDVFGGGLMEYDEADAIEPDAVIVDEGPSEPVVEVIDQTQRRRLFALARAAGLSEDELRGALEARTGTASTRDLPVDVWRDLCTELDAAAEARAAGEPAGDGITDDTEKLQAKMDEREHREALAMQAEKDLERGRLTLDEYEAAKAAASRAVMPRLDPDDPLPDDEAGDAQGTLT